MDKNLQRTYSTESSDTENEYFSPEGSEGSDKEDGESDTFYDATDCNVQLACDLGIHDHGHHSTGTEQLQQTETFQETDLVPSDETGAYIRVLRTLKPVEVNAPDTLKEFNFRYKDDDWISVTFHVLIAPEVKFDCRTDKISMHIWSTLGNTDTHLAKVEPQFVCYRKNADGAAEYICSALFKRIGFYGNVSYLYHIEKTGASSKGKPRTSFFEKVFLTSNNRRQLNFKYSTKYDSSKESSDEYDGFVYKPNKQTSFWSWGSTPSKRNTDDTENVINVFGKEIIELLIYKGLCSKSVAEFVERIKCLVLCMDRNYSIKSTQVSQAVKPLLENKLLSFFHCEEELNVEMKLTMACAILKLHTSGTIKLLPDEHAFELLCKSFIPTIHKTQNVSIEWEILCTENNKDTRNELHIQLGTLAKEICIVKRKQKSPLWMYLVPILHLLDGMCQPFQQKPLDIKHNENIPKWWGQSDLLLEVSNLFRKYRESVWVKPLTEVIDSMRCLPKLDFYLPRTIMASLCFEELKDAIDTNFFPPDVCCAALYFYLKCRSKHDNPQLSKCLDSLLYQITSADKVMEKNQIIASIIISIDMLREALQKQHEGIVKTSVKIMLWLLAAKDTCGEENQEENDSLFDLSKISNDICRWISNNKNKRQQFIEYLQVWNTFFETANLHSTYTITRWKGLMKESFKSQIKNEIQEHRKRFANVLVQTYCTGLEGFCEIIRDVLTPFVCNVLGDVKTLKQSSMPKSEYQNLCKAVASKFVRECENITQKKGNFDLKTILSWPALPVFLELLYENKTPAVIDEACDDNICKIGEGLKVFNDMLMKGTITVEELILIHKNKGVYMSLNNILHRDENTAKILETRYWEMTKYFENLSALKSLKSLCQQLEGVTVDTKAIDEILDIDIDGSSLCDLVVIASEHETNRVFVIRSKSLPPAVVDVLLHIEKLSNSVCLRDQWQDEALKLMPGSTLSLDELIRSIYEPVRKRLQEFEVELKNGSLTYKDINSFVGRFYEDNYEDMISALSQICLSTNKKLIQTRIEQFRQCKEVIAKAEIATEIIDIQTIYELTGNFQPIEKISHVDIQNTPVSSDRGVIIAASKSLERLTKKELYCLKIFVKCYELVQWLRESMTHDFYTSQQQVSSAMWKL